MQPPSTAFRVQNNGQPVPLFVWLPGKFAAACRNSPLRLIEEDSSCNTELFVDLLLC